MKTMKPDFKQMSRQDLKKYVLSHPTDDEALRELVLNRRNPNAKIFPPEFNNFHEVIKSVLSNKSNRKSSSVDASPNIKSDTEIESDHS